MGGAGNEISLKFYFLPEFCKSDLIFGILENKLCRTQIVSSNSDGFLGIFCDFQFSVGGRNMKFYGVSVAFQLEISLK